MQDATDCAFSTKSWANRVASVCIERYLALPRAGKPGADEWAPLAGIVAFVPFEGGVNSLAKGGASPKGVALLERGAPLEGEGTLLEKGVVCEDVTLPPKGVVKCVALGTGSKCLGGNELSGGGVRVHDSHAEVLARRGFLRYLLCQVERALTDGDSDVLEAGPTGCCVRPGVSFHAYVSEPPCGDAAIFPSDEHALRAARAKLPGKRRLDDDDEDSMMVAKRFSEDTRNESIQESGDQRESRLPNLTHQTAHVEPHLKIKSPANLTANVKSSDAGRTVWDYSQKPFSTIQGDTATQRSNTVGITVDEKSLVARIPQESAQKPTSKAQQDIKIQKTNAENATADEELSDTERILQKSTHQPTEEARDGSPMQERDPASATEAVIASDVHRTGAKCVGGGIQDRHAPGAGYHVTGAVRTKPGRGDPTLSLSCSDKMARWHAVGVQGALLSLLVPRPVRYRSISIAGDVTWSAVALRRALTARACAKPAPLSMAQASLGSPAGRGDCGRPCAAGVVWSDVPHRSHEVVARGLKQGVTKKAAGTPAGRLKICRKELAKEFVRVYSLAAHRISRLRRHSSCSDIQMPGRGGGSLGLDAGRVGSNVRNLDMSVDGQAIVCTDNGVAVNSGLADSIVLEDHCQYQSGQNGMSNYKQDALDKVDVHAFKSDANACHDADNRDKPSMCLVENEVLNSSAGELSGFHHLLLENDGNCDQADQDCEIFAESLGKMTYAQLKAMACDYQRRWRHVRESHFPVWTVKRGGLQDFVVSDE